VRVPDALIQPVATQDFADKIARVAEAEPLNGIVNVGGPGKISFEQMAREVLPRHGESKVVVVDAHARYFGAPLPANSLVVP
jgi:dTDP-4-dehydrorhamnose reductase